MVFDHIDDRFSDLEKYSIPRPYCFPTECKLSLAVRHQFLEVSHTDQRGTLTPEDTLTPDQLFMVLTQGGVSIFDFYVLKKY